jgi:hypothetical protein
VQAQPAESENSDETFGHDAILKRAHPRTACCLSPRFTKLSRHFLNIDEGAIPDAGAAQGCGST